MPCKKHIEDNMKTKMQSLQLDGSERSMILEDVFGCTTPPKRGLVDCSATEKLETTLADGSHYTLSSVSQTTYKEVWHLEFEEN